MTWSKNPDHHAAMYANVINVLSEENQHIRWHKALAHIGTSAALYGDPDDRTGAYCATLANAALYPENYADALREQVKTA